MPTPTKGPRLGGGPAHERLMLANLAPAFGYDPADVTRYNTKFRNVVLSRLSAERLLILYSSGGLDAVTDELQALRRRGII